MAKRISIDNGATFTDILSVFPVLYTANLWDKVFRSMDQQILEDLRSKLSPCAKVTILFEYLEAAQKDLII